MNITNQAMAVTPELAREFLKTNSTNRPLKRGTVQRYAQMMRNGEWRLTPQSVVFDTNGVLINGQHTLHAVIESGTTVQLMVSRGWPAETFAVLDRGANRTAADALRIEKRLTEVARLAAVVCLDQRPSQISDARTAEMTAILEPEHTKLMEFCSTTAPLFSSAGFRLAACARLKVDAPAYILNTYRNLVLASKPCKGVDLMERMSQLPPIARGVLESHLRERRTGGSSNQMDSLARAWSIFDRTKADNKKVQVKDPANQAREISALLTPKHWKAGAA